MAIYGQLYYISHIGYYNIYVVSYSEYMSIGRLMFIPMKNLTPTGRAILLAINELQRDQSRITQQQIADHVGVGHRTVVRHIQFMKDEGLVEIVSRSPKSGGSIYVCK